MVITFISLIRNIGLPGFSVVINSSALAEIAAVICRASIALRPYCFARWFASLYEFFAEIDSKGHVIVEETVQEIRFFFKSIVNRVGKNL